MVTSTCTYVHISILWLQVHTLDLPGRPGRNMNRHMQVSPAADALLVYWPIASEEAWPWAPMTNEEERANLCIVSPLNATGGAKPNIILYTKTECEPLDIRFRYDSYSQQMVAVIYFL